MDYVMVSTKERYLAVCISCEHVFCDYRQDDLRGPFNVEYLKLVSSLKELLRSDEVCHE